MAYFTGAVLTPTLLTLDPFQILWGKGLIFGLLTCGILLFLGAGEASAHGNGCMVPDFSCNLILPCNELYRGKYVYFLKWSS